MRQKIQGPALCREAEINKTIDKEERRISVSFSSETPVLRESWFSDPWVEILGHDDGEVKLDRANSGAPVLYNHSRWGQSDLLGVIESAWIDGGRGYAILRMSKRADVDDIWRDIEDGILKNVSVGYNIHERTLIGEHSDKPNEYRVTSWEPLEISLVGIPADHTVGVGRQMDGGENLDTSNRYTITDCDRQSSTTGDQLMAENTQVESEQSTDRQEIDNVESIEAAARKKALAEDRARRSEIRSRCATIKDKYPWVADIESRALADDTTPDAVTSEILQKLGEDMQPLATDPKIEVVEDQSDKLRIAASNAILVRANIRSLVGRDGMTGVIDMRNNPFRGATLLQIAERILRANGTNPDGLDKRTLVARAFQTTSDFPNLLEDAIHKSLLNAYRAVADTWSRFCRTGTVSDFREHKRYRTGSIGNYDELNEHGEYQRKTIPDAEKSVVTATTRGNIIGVTREVIINDDLGAMMDLSVSLGRAGARTIEAAVYAALAENSGNGPTMLDGAPLFDATHNNIEATTVGAPSVDTFEACRILMASQLDVGGNDFLDLRPDSWVGPIGLGGDARVVNDAQYDPDTANKLQRPNKVRGLVNDIIDTPRLSGNPWFLFADPNDAPVLEVAFLDGEQEPYIETQDGWNVDGAEIKARLDFGVGVVDYRGAVKNNGA